MNNKTILICDDEKHMLRLLSFTLSKTGCRVESVSDGDQALARVAQGGIDLLVIDVMMPGKDGFETVRELRRMKEGATLPIIILTARGAATMRDEAGQLGVSHFVTKPFSPIQIQEQVKLLLDET
jgi:DNA-binding response OmpR family regulator